MSCHHTKTSDELHIILTSLQCYEPRIYQSADDAFVILHVISEHLDQKVGSVVKAEY